MSSFRSTATLDPAHGQPVGAATPFPQDASFHPLPFAPSANDQTPDRADHRADARLRALLDASADAILTIGCNGVITEINPAGIEMLEAATAAELTGAQLAVFVADDNLDAFSICIHALSRGEKGYAEFECIGRAGGRRWIEMRAAPLRDSAGHIVAALGILRDNTARRDLNKQFIQAQKMEVLGALAGGVAHDFNNMLGIILGYTEMLMEGMPLHSQQRQDAQSIFHTAQRAATLTQQLLIFSRKQTPQPQAINLSDLVIAVDQMLRRLIGDNLKLVTIPEPDLAHIHADPCQIEQILMNLTINARDAMPGGGAITIETANVIVANADPAHPRVPAGAYVMLSVRDTGAGMTEELMAKIFEPFFTTKPAGQGTGLGLATCLGIVRHWHGHLDVESRLGAGTTFRAYFPSLPASALAIREKNSAGPVPRGTETILLVEDEPGLLALTTTVLQRQGYTVIKAANGREALGLVHQRHGNRIDLVLSDMVMPEMGGRMMADWLYATDPAIKILFTTGYTNWGREGVVDPSMDFIAKPYTPSGLLRKIREVIDRPPAIAGHPMEDAA